MTVGSPFLVVAATCTLLLEAAGGSLLLVVVDDSPLHSVLPKRTYCIYHQVPITILLRYMSQVTYGILRICRVGFLRISERRSVDVREPSAESSLVIRGIIAGYPRNHR